MDSTTSSETVFEVDIDSLPISLGWAKGTGIISATDGNETLTQFIQVTHYVCADSNCDICDFVP